MHPKNFALLLLLPLLLAVACSKKRDPGTPQDSPFGLDDRPANPTCTAPDRPPNQANVQLDVAFGGEVFNQPILATQHPTDDDRWYVARKAGLIDTFLASDPSNTRVTALDVTGTLVGTTGNTDERGLLGLAFHPNFTANNYVYVSYVNSAQQDNVIERWEILGDGTFDMGTGATEIFRSNQNYSNHNGGNIAFSPLDGFLYIGIGDGGLGNDPDQAGQNVNVLQGKMLRIDVDGGTPYAIPSDNPFAQGGGAPEVYAWGLRNPWRFSFDQVSGELWVGDVGQGAYEEISVIERGGNYGWNIMEADQCRVGSTCDQSGLLNPVVTHPQSGPAEMRASSITGGYVYRGTEIPELTGTYVYGDYKEGNIWALEYDNAGNPAPRRLLNIGPDSISSFGQARNGEIYVVDYNADQILELNPAGPAQPNNFPQTLSATGCMDPDDVTKFYSGVIPYDIVAPFWSDGATKERGFAIPDGQTIDNGADGDWDLPIGSVAIKNFFMDGTLFETRLLVRHNDGEWAGYTYEWRLDLSDADLLPASKQTQVAGSNDWLYPARSSCLQCHTAIAGRSLGFETQQMNRSFVYEFTNRNSNQLTTLDHIGMFSTPLVGADNPSTLPSLPATYGSDAVDLRARTYLHTNCSMCHRENGTGQGPQDFLYSTSFAEMNVCNADPQEGDLGVPGAKLLDPGSPSSSILSVRMHATDATKMPTVGLRADPQGTALIDEWITGVSTCQ